MYFILFLYIFRKQSAVGDYEQIIRLQTGKQQFIVQDATKYVQAKIIAQILQVVVYII